MIGRGLLFHCNSGYRHRKNLSKKGFLSACNPV